jgi:transglutaminase-like putative cysteine protease
MKLLRKPNAPSAEFVRRRSLADRRFFSRIAVLRRISLVVLVSFTATCVQPVFAAAGVHRIASNSNADLHGDLQYSQTLDAIAAVTRTSLAKGAGLRSAESEVREMLRYETVLKSLDARMVAAFDEDEIALRRADAPSLMFGRLASAREEFLERRGALEKALTEVSKAQAAGDGMGQKVALQALDALLAGNTKRRIGSFDPRDLPLRVAPESVRAAQADPKRLQEILSAGPKSSSVEAATKIASKALSTAPSADDLAETDEIQFTPAIRDLAVTLGKDATKIHWWVRNNIEFLPTYGGMQSSDLTLKSGRGNAFDIASLQLALYRASGIPSRYVYGTVEVSTGQVMNWVGGVNRPEAAVALMSQGGIPISTIIEGGRIARVQLEHVWVEAFVDYYPSRGVVNRNPSTWIPSDAAFKQYTYSDGMDIKANVPFDAAAVLASAKGATYAEGNGWVQNLSSASLQSQIEAYQTRVGSYVAAQNPNATPGDVLGTKQIVATTLAFLPATLPYKTIAIGGRFQRLPDNLRYRVAMKFYSSQADRESESPAFVVNKPLSVVSGSRVSLTYPAASSADQAILSNAIASDQLSFPAYLVHTTPTLSVEDAVMATGPTATVGTPQLLSIDMVSPSGIRTKDYNITAGDLSVLGLNPAGFTASFLTSRTAQHDLAVVNEQNPAAESLYQVVVGWWAQKHAFNGVVSAANHVVTYQLPSHALAAAPVSVRFAFGVARSASYKRRVVDGKEDLLSVVHRDMDDEVRRRCMVAFGKVGSSLEGLIFHQAFAVPANLVISTTSMLKSANDQGVRTYTVTQANAASVLPQLQLDPDVQGDVTNAVGAGMRVTVPQRDVQVGQFLGTGYIVEDPVSGAAAYLISGGLNGGSSPSQESVYPLPEVPLTGILSFMAGAGANSGGVSLIVTEGRVAAGIAIPAVEGTAAFVAAGGTAAATAAAIVAAIVAVLVIIAIAIVYVETKYPRQAGVRFRHYSSSKGAAAIEGSKLILKTVGGTFGDGAYVADAASESGRGVGCPPNGLDVATRFQIPEPGNILPERAAAWVEFEITRANLYQMGGGVNGVGQAEIVIQSPLMPTIHPLTGNWTRALYIGTFALGIEYIGACY